MIKAHTLVFILVSMHTFVEANFPRCTEYYINTELLKCNIAPSMLRCNGHSLYSCNDRTTPFMYYSHSDCSWVLNDTPCKSLLGGTLNGSCEETDARGSNTSTLQVHSRLETFIAKCRAYDTLGCYSVDIISRAESDAKYLGTYLRTKSDRHGRDVFRNSVKGLYLYYTGTCAQDNSTSPCDWYGWVVSTSPTVISKSLMFLAARSDALHPAQVVDLWESRNMLDWVFEKDVKTLCTEDVLVPIADTDDDDDDDCKDCPNGRKWKRVAIGLASGIGLVIIMSFMVFLCGEMQSENKKMSSRRASFATSNSEETEQFINDQAMTFIDMGEVVASTDQEGATVSPTAPAVDMPPDYETVMRESRENLCESGTPTE